ncbi:MAG: hypothetical protein ABR592_11640 [Nitriliruptorales bacterium]
MGDRSGPPFERVALAGHSGDGVIAELTAVSFHRVDALIVTGWADGGAHPFVPRAFTRMRQRCVTAPGSKRPGGAGGWAFLFTRRELEMLVHDVDPQVLEAFIAVYEQDPCGWFGDSETALTANIARAPTVDVPVLLVSGEHDAVAPPPAVELQRARYELGRDDVTCLMVAGTGHQIMFERRAPVCVLA